MAISDKLTYLNTTKGKIKDSINLTGANIGSNDTFRSYAVKLRDGLLNVLNNGTIVLYNNFPKVSGTGSNISLSNTLEAPMFMNKFDGDTLQDGTPTPSTPIEIQSVEGIQNITIGDGTNSDSYTIDLGNIKLYNGDYITGTPDNWSIVRNNKEKIFNGSEEGWTLLTTSNLNNYLIDGQINDINYISNVINYKSNYYKGILNANRYQDNTFFVNNNKRIVFTNNSITSVNNWKTNLATNNISVVYPLATPTTTPITDTTLITQLNALYNAKSYDGQTNISVDGQLPMILEVSALKDEI